MFANEDGFEGCIPKDDAGGNEAVDYCDDDLEYSSSFGNLKGTN
jgi:hypothetical protein